MAAQREMLTRAQVTEMCGFSHVNYVNKLLKRSAARRAEGKTTNMFPEPDLKPGGKPLWYRTTIERWLERDRLHRGEHPKAEPGQKPVPGRTAARTRRGRAHTTQAAPAANEADVHAVAS
jgi:hypothetical protein